MTALEPEARTLLTVLSGLKGWANYWGGPDLPAVWWPAGNPPPFPQYWQSVYFSVNPRATRLSGKRRGGIKDVSHLTCLYSEMDIKDGRSLADVQNLEPAPSCVVSSGGGWHCYWFIEPVLVDDTNRDELNRLQRRWVAFTDGDPGAPDISRVLRVPGSYNLKYSPARKVEVLTIATGLRYDLRDLVACLPREEEPQDGWKAPAVRAYETPPRDNAEEWLSRAVAMAAPGVRNRVGFWLACQLRDAGLPQAAALYYLERYQAQVTTARDPYTLQEAKDNIRSAYRTAPREPAGRAR